MRLLAQERQPVGEAGLQHDDGLGAQRAVLRAAERQHVDAGVRSASAPQRHVERGRGVGEARAVDVHEQAARVRPVGERAELVDGVDGAELGRLRERHDLGLHVVLVADPPHRAVDELARELAVGRRDVEQLGAEQPARARRTRRR